jgi:ABC-type nitrate/sulfonate/bicarbonate transport system ATPase subunit
MTPLVALHNVYKSFHHLPVLTGITCGVEEGEIVSLVGPSGCGKSTLLRLMGGAETPDGGQVERRFRQVGFVFQEPRLLPWRTALENVTLVLLETVPGREQRGGRARELLAQVGVREALALGERLVLLSARPAQVRQVFDLRGQPRDGWQLGAGLRQIEAEVTQALLQVDERTGGNRWDTLETAA